MRNLIIGFVVAISFAACKNANNNLDNNKVSTDTTKLKGQSNNTQTSSKSPIKEIISGYLQLKNGLGNDNGNDAASGGKAILEAMAKFDSSGLSTPQRKVYDDLADDINDNAEHISENSGHIAHQRQHFDMLSKDMYDLAKTFAGEPILYKDYCPMYNNGKGAIWLSETKEIKNPYLGKKMPACGEVKEEIK
jgi:hypothetical protein